VQRTHQMAQMQLARRAHATDDARFVHRNYRSQSHRNRAGGRMIMVRIPVNIKP
jgi:hypothetical protein